MAEYRKPISLPINKKEQDKLKSQVFGALRYGRRHSKVRFSYNPTTGKGHIEFGALAIPAILEILGPYVQGLSHLAVAQEPRSDTQKEFIKSIKRMEVDENGRVKKKEKMLLQQEQNNARYRSRLVEEAAETKYLEAIVDFGKPGFTINTALEAICEGLTVDPQTRTIKPHELVEISITQGVPNISLEPLTKVDRGLLHGLISYLTLHNTEGVTQGEMTASLEELMINALEVANNNPDFLQALE